MLLPRNSSEFEELKAQVVRDAALLKPHELRWRDRQRFLEKHGYMLRERFRPGWVPSWESNGGEPDEQEDYWGLPPRVNVIDATRISDGRPVYIKRVETGNEEIDISTYFCQSPRLEDPQNHCVPVLETFQDDLQPHLSYMVMPFLRFVDDPPLEFVRDVVDCVNQLLDGLVFIHAHHVAHRDCSSGNLMMDASGMYPRGHHLDMTDLLPDISGEAPFVPRIAARPPVKYYYIDFGISSRFSPEDKSRLVHGTLGRDQEVPELSNNVAYDPFKVDVFLVGNALRQMMHDKYSNVKFLQPLIESMTHEDPSLRPTAVQALKAWEKVRKNVWLTSRVRRLHEHSESPTGSLLLDVYGLLELGSALTRRLFQRRVSSPARPRMSPGAEDLCHPSLFNAPHLATKRQWKAVADDPWARRYLT